MSQSSIKQKSIHNAAADDIQYWRMRWFFVALLTFLLIVSVVGSIVVFLLTKSPYSGVIFVPSFFIQYSLYRFIIFLLPLSKEERLLEEKRIERETEKYRLKKQGKT